MGLTTRLTPRDRLTEIEEGIIDRSTTLTTQEHTMLILLVIADALVGIAENLDMRAATHR